MHKFHSSEHEQDQRDRRSKFELMNIQISKCDRSVWREFLLTEKVKLHLYYHSSISYTCTDIVYKTTSVSDKTGAQREE